MLLLKDVSLTMTFQFEFSIVPGVDPNISSESVGFRDHLNGVTFMVEQYE